MVFGGSVVEANDKLTRASGRGWSLMTFRHGMESGKAGRPASANPHHPDSDHAAIWEGGWHLGREMTPPPGE